MNQIKKNTVSSKNQILDKEHVTFLNKEGRGTRILFVGNSITRHAAAPHIGWNHDWGMAASSIDKDYVHLIAKQVQKNDPDAAFCICHVGDWERNYKTGGEVLPYFAEARGFKADTVVMRLIENCPTDGFEPELFRREYKRLIDYLAPEGAKVIITTGFWKHPGDRDILSVAAERGYPAAELGYLGEDDSMKAIGLFEHSGVANHPGDKGMKAIADEILKLLN